MVKSAERRIARYKGKIDPDVYRSRISALGEEMKKEAEVGQTAVTNIQAQVRSILDEHGINPVFAMPYQACAQELGALVRKFSGKTLEAEADLVLDKWYARGLVCEVLEDIAKMFGITWTCPTY